MLIGRIKGATRVIGKSQGYYGLPVRDEIRASGVDKGIAALAQMCREQADTLLSKFPGAKGTAAMLLDLSETIPLLPLRDERQNNRVDGPDTPVMVTAWQPTPDELDALNKGAMIHVELLGTQHPPIMVKVGPLPE